MGNRYKVWRTHTGPTPAERLYVLIVADRPEGPETNWSKRVPELIQGLGFWSGGVGGLLSRLKPVYRQALALQGFMVLSGLPGREDLERPPRRRVRWRVREIGK